MRLTIRHWIKGALLLCCLAASLAYAADQPPRVRIGIVLDGPWERNDEVVEGFRTEIRELIGRDHQVEFPAHAFLVADWTLPGIQQAVDSLMADSEVDLVLAIGALSAQVVGTRGALNKPTLAPYVIDIELQGLPYHDGGSGVPNLNYLTAGANFQRQVATFHDVVPFKKLAILTYAPYLAALSGKPERYREFTTGLGFESVPVPVGHSVQEALEQLPEGTEAVFVVPLLHLPAGEFQRLVDGLIERRLPSFSLLGRDEVERGLMVGLTHQAERQRVARRVALNIQRILAGEDAGGLPVDWTQREQLVINMATARAIEKFPSFDVLTEAVLLKEERTDVQRKMSLQSVVQEALEINLALRAQEKAVESGRQDVRRARSTLLPQVGIGATARVIDQDRAAAAMGSAPERLLDVSASVTQLLWSDQARTGLAIESELQRGREAAERAVRLDTIQQSAKAFLDVLRAKSAEGVNRENLRVTRSNLELARVRHSIGVARPGEVYRWESRIATGRTGVIRASALRNVAEIALNRLLHRPGEEPFETEDVGTDVLYRLSANPQLRPYVDNPWGFDVFRDFMAEEAQRDSPELEQIDAAIAAQELLLRNKRRAYWSPTVALQGELARTVAKGGAGTEGIRFPPEAGVELAEADDTNWGVGVNLSFSAFESGAKQAELIQARVDLERLRLERASVSDRVDQNVRSALHLLGASWSAIELSQKAADAATRNFELVEDAYSQGAVSVLDLLDAQNSALIARLEAANALYDHLSDIMDTMRAAGSFDHLLVADADSEFLQRLDSFVEQRRYGNAPPSGKRVPTDQPDLEAP